MAYDLALRAARPDQPPDPAALRASLARAAPDVRQFAAAPEAPATDANAFGLKNGDAQLKSAVVFDGERCLGVDLSVPLGGREEELRDVLAFGLALAARHGLVLFDPQLAAQVERSNVEAVVQKWRENQSWSAEIAGGVEDPRGLMQLAMPKRAEVSPRLKVVLVVGGIFLALYVLLDVLTREPNLPPQELPHTPEVTEQLRRRQEDLKENALRPPPPPEPAPAPAPPPAPPPPQP